MPVCSRCGAWNLDAALSCEKCGAKQSSEVSTASSAGILSRTPDSSEWRWKRSDLLAALMVLSTVAGVLLAKSAIGKYDATAQGVLDSKYTVETRKSSSGAIESKTYNLTYKFAVDDTQYTGQDSQTTEPASAGTTVYYVANNPRENGLNPNHANVFNAIAAGVAFLIAILAYALIPRSRPIRSGAVFQAAAERVGDSGNEAARMKHGRYRAWLHVHFGFFVQMGLVGYLAAMGLASHSHGDAISYTILGVASFVASVSTLWVYADRWRCIEAFSSRFCSGSANLSILYVPVVAIIYANYRGLKKLVGR